MNQTARTTWLALLQAVFPAFEGRVFAFGDSCVAAVHYADFYEGMQDFDFAVLREDYEALIARLIPLCEREGLTLDADATVNGIVVPKPYVRVGKAACPDVWLRIFPLDAIPVQVTLRFKLFKESAALMERYRTMEEGDNFAGLPALASEMVELGRYNGLQEGLVARLCGFSKSGRMGEKTIFQRTIEVTDLFPVRELPFAGVRIPVAQKVSNWTLEMTPERERAIKIIQQESLVALQEVDRVCKKLGITYFLVGGSMLGALRHGGFIPWDDDTDVGMLRHDYDRFVREAPAHLAPGYFVQLPETDPHIHFVYARLRKEGYDYITAYNEDKDFNKGIWVDVFPFDASPKVRVLQKVQRRVANVMARASMALMRRREYVQHDVALDAPLPAEDARYLRRFAAMARLFPVSLTRWGYHRAARACNWIYGGKPDAMYASFIPSYTTISANEVDPVRRIAYEGTPLDIPAGAEAFLVRQYGDYEKLPCVHERYAEHGFKYLQDADGARIGR
ncbi:MAG: LicD family protein [Eggerthellaceae bacterium]|nr:LicD family protein [Eggerthellaceae bacterium]